MAESIIRWFIAREKYCSLAENVRLIRQTNMVYIIIIWESIPIKLNKQNQSWNLFEIN
jgi:hypothetical protein